MARALRRRDHGPAPPARRLARLPARAVHDGRGLRARGPQVLRPPLRPRPPLPREPDRQLVPALRERDLRPRGQPPRRERHAVHDPLPARGRRGRTSRSRRCARRRCSPTSPSPCIPTTSATAISSARRRSCPSPSGGSRSSPTTASIPSSAPARSRSRPATIRWTSRSGATHGLPELTVIGLDGHMNEDAGDFAGLDAGRGRRADRRDPARAGPARVGGAVPALGRPLRSLRLADRAADHAAVVVRHDGARRAGDRGRPRRPRPLPSRALTRTSTSPGWSPSARWCVSRQLWWGHRIPVWYCPDGHMTVVESEPEACAECGSSELRQDEDVLDTWFSSQLWPFATLGWPDDTPELGAGTRTTSARPTAGSSSSGRRGCSWPGSSSWARSRSTR